MKALGIVALVVGLTAAPFVLDGETETLGEAQRVSAVGVFADLSAGTVHYQVGGPLGGEPVVLVHGLSTPLFTWDAVFAGLTSAGFRVLRYDLFGRGLSDRPTDVNYDQDLYDTQLHELLQTIGWRGRVHLVGLSMGGAIAVEYAARHPDWVASLSLFDPAGFPVDMPFAVKLLKVPGVGEYLMKTVGDSVIRKNLGTNFHDQTLLPAFAARFAPQMKIKGFKHGQLSTLRHMPLGEMAGRYRAVGRSGLPVLLIWGKQDRVVPLANAALIQEAIPHTELLVVDRCGHTPNYEKPAAVLPALIGFLSSKAVPTQGDGA